MRFSSLFRPVAVGLLATALILPGVARAGATCAAGADCKAMCAAKEAKLVEKLALTPERAAVVVPLVKELDTTYHTWMTTRKEIIKAMHEATKDANTTDAAYNELWTKLTTAKMTFDSSLAGVMTKMTQQMTPSERVKVTVFETNFMRKMMKGMMRHEGDMKLQKEEIQKDDNVQENAIAR